MKLQVLAAIVVTAAAAVSVRGADLSSSFDSLSAANAATLRFATISLSELQAYAPSDEIDWAEADQTDFLPALPRPAVATPVRRTALVTNDGLKEVLTSRQDVDNVRVRSRYHASGEIGASYGFTTGGRYSAESEAGYIIGGVGNDKLQITAGATYQNTTTHLPRFGR